MHQPTEEECNPFKKKVKISDANISLLTEANFKITKVCTIHPYIEI